jgi:Polyketide cyclase / dehydrase and lipid transport
MASIRKEIVIDADPDAVWDAVRDFGALHVRLAPGFVTDCHLDGTDRIVTFFTGTVLRERLVARDDETRRLVWAIIDGPYSHHNGAVEVTALDDGRTRYVWTTDVLPDELGEPTSQQMERGIAAVEATLTAQAVPDAQASSK